MVTAETRGKKVKCPRCDTKQVSEASDRNEVVYGEVHDALVFIPRPRAVELATEKADL